MVQLASRENLLALPLAEKFECNLFSFACIDQGHFLLLMSNGHER